MNDEWLTKNPFALDIAERRDQRIVGAIPVEPIKMTALMVWAKTNLRDVAAENVDVEKLVQMKGRAHGERALVCGERSNSSFVRNDGIRCNFEIVVRESDRGLELRSYVLHLDAPEKHLVEPSFLRWEYSPERKINVDAVKEPLAHLHPGHDHVRIPAPVLTPKELITVFLALELWV